MQTRQRPALREAGCQTHLYPGAGDTEEGDGEFKASLGNVARHCSNASETCPHTDLHCAS